MNYLRWLTEEELKAKLTKVNTNTEVKKSGIPMAYDDNSLYIDDSEQHSLVIGTTGSGKVQSILLPQSRLAIRASESLVINDTKGEIYESLKEDLKNNNYNIVILNLENPSNGNSYNPLKPAYQQFKVGNKDKAMELVENIAYYLFSERKTNNSDPFWENSAINYFTGLAFYLFEKEEQPNITLNRIFDLSTEININKETLERILSDIKGNPAIYANLVGILQAPIETRGSIISVFSQKLKLYISRENLSEMMSKTDFDITKIAKVKTAIFIIGGNVSYANALIPLIVNQIYYMVDIYGNQEKRVNIIVNEFGKINRIKDFINVINNARSINIKFTIFVMSLLELRNVYGDETTEFIKISFGNIIYLLANDIETLEEISKRCGKKDNIPLITPEELKLLDMFEAIILMPRVLPIRTKLKSDSEIKWTK